MFNRMARLPRLPQMPRLPFWGGQVNSLLAAPGQMVARNRAAQRARAGAVLAELLDHLLESGSFSAGLQRQPGFTTRRGVEGLTCLRHEGILCGAILTQRAAALQFALRGAEEFASATLTTLLTTRFNTLPRWHSAEAGGLWLDQPLAPGVTLRLSLRDGPVDPLFIGRDLPGLAVDLTLLTAD